MRLSNRCLARVVAALVAGVLICQGATAQAGFVGQGWSGFLDGFVNYPATVEAAPNGDATVNFAVYENTDGDWTNDFGASFQSGITSLLGSLQSAAKFVYFFQVVNTNFQGTSSADIALSALEIPTLASSAGFVKGFVFNDSTGAVGGTSNAYLGTNPGSGFSDASGNGVPTNSVGGLAPTAFVASASAINSSGAATTPIGWVSDPLSANPIATGIAFSFLSSATPPKALLTTGKYSSVVFFTSNDPLQYLTSRVDGPGGVNTFNELPSPIRIVNNAASVPEPSSFVLLLGGLGSLFVFGRKQITADAAA